jgi:hypothetical protein
MQVYASIQDRWLNIDKTYNVRTATGHVDPIPLNLKVEPSLSPANAAKFCRHVKLYSQFGVKDERTQDKTLSLLNLNTEQSITAESIWKSNAPNTRLIIA